MDGTLIRVYSVANTVADCYKYRNKIGDWQVELIHANALAAGECPFHEKSQRRRCVELRGFERSARFRKRAKRKSELR